MREQEFRERAERLVLAHWPEIVAVAAGLLKWDSLDAIEIELIADRAAGVLQADVEEYRRLFRRGRPVTDHT